MQLSDIAFVVGIAALLVGAFGQDRMKRVLHAREQLPRERMRALQLARHYRRHGAELGLPSWPIALFYIGFGAGYALLFGAVALLFV